MAQVMGVLETVVPVLVMLGLGMVARRTGLISRAGIGDMRKFVMNITLPAVLFSAFSTASYSIESLFTPLAMFIVCVIAMALGRVGGKLLKLPSRFVPFLTTGFEAGMLGYALFALLYGQAAVERFALIDLGQVLFVFTLYTVLLGRMEGKAADAGAIVRSLVTSPTILAIAAGVALGASGLMRDMRAFGGDALCQSIANFISAPTAGVILMTIGYDLVPREIRWKEALSTVALRLLVMGVLLLALLPVVGRVFPNDPMTKNALILMFLLPPPYVLPIMADDEDERAYVSSVLSILTLVAIAGFAVLAALA
ncbi:MAG: AEC family transporter [Clostridia bacterium]